MASTFGALLLDFDGTVADTHELTHRCLDETTREFLGREFPHRLWRETVGLPLRDIFEQVLAPDDVGRVSADELVTNYRARLLEADHPVHPFPGIRAVLETLRDQGVALAIVTSKRELTVRLHLAKAGLDDLFELVVAGDHTARLKPDPDPFLAALAALHLPATAGAAVGDTPLDIEAGRAAGMVTIAACWGTLNREALLGARPDIVAESPRALLNL